MFLKWNDQPSLTFICVDKWQETPDTISIRITPKNHTLPIKFIPGQFVSLGIEIAGKIHYRSYSISSLPNQTFIQLTIKRTNNGLVSNFMFNHFKIDDQIEVMEPCGQFNIDNCLVDTQKIENIVLISAGCGITPLYAIAQYLLKNTDKSVQLIHVAKNTTHTIFYENLVALDKKYTNFKLSLLLKEFSNSAHEQGRFCLEYLKQQLTDMNNTGIFICGPEQFMQDTQRYLAALNFDLNYCYQESFSTSQKANLNTDIVKPLTITIEDHHLTLAANDNEVLADVLEKAQAPIVIACRSGVCGACKCKVTKGSVTMSEQHVLTQDEIEQGYVLACSTIVHEDINLVINPS